MIRRETAKMRGKAAMYGRIALVLGMCCIPRLAAAQTPSVLVRVQPAVTDVQVGETFTVDLIADLGPNKVIGWGLDLAYDDSALARLGAPAIGPLWLPSFAPDGDGLTGFSAAGASTGPDALLATLTYRALAAGQTQLAPGYTPTDLNEGFPLDPIGYATVSFQVGTVNIVPEPASLLLVALGGILTCRSRRRAK